MNPVGYLHNTAKELVGDSGLGYNYILAQNGLFIQAENDHLKATVQLAEATVRGLALLEAGIELIHGKIPAYLWPEILGHLKREPHNELFVAITWEGDYRLHIPVQEVGPAHVTYAPLPHTVLEIHSHGYLPAFFSNTDDRDEQGFRIFGVCGRMNTLLPEYRFRVGIYGCFAPLELGQVFA